MGKMNDLYIGKKSTGLIPTISPSTKIDTDAFRSRSRSAQPLEVHSMLIECLDELDRLCK